MIKPEAVCVLANCVVEHVRSEIQDGSKVDGSVTHGSFFPIKDGPQAAISHSKVSVPEVTMDNHGRVPVSERRQQRLQPTFERVNLAGRPPAADDLAGDCDVGRPTGGQIRTGR